MGVFNQYINNLDYYNDMVLNMWKTDSNFIENFDSYYLFKLINHYTKSEEGKSLIERDLNKILSITSENFNLFDTFTIIKLKNHKLTNETFDEKYMDYLKKIMSSKTLIFIYSSLRKMDSDNLNNKADIFNYIFDELKAKKCDDSSICLFDLSLLPDFKEELNKRYNIVGLLIDRYQRYDVDVVSTKLFNGSSIIGKLIQDENQYIVEDYVKDLSNSKEYSDVKMIGGGGSCLVYKIGKYVLKLGETRNCRKIYVNHRILASQVRKLHTDINQKELFYAEIMKYVRTDGITQEDVDELKSDLARQGLIWDDAKIENCGILDEDDNNVSILPVDYVEVAGNIDNQVDREEFQKRKRRVVVLDNDNITFNPLKSCR